jgi:hypothetical protein
MEAQMNCETGHPAAVRKQATAAQPRHACRIGDGLPIRRHLHVPHIAQMFCRENWDE